MDDQTTLTEVPSVEPAGTTAEDTLGLVVLWSRDEPWRVGEVFLLPQGSGPLLLGRGGFRADDPHPRLVPHRLRRGSAAATQPLASPTISRRQLLCRVKGGRIELQNIGRCAMRVGGVEKQTADVGVGALIELGNSMLIGCGWQPAWSYDAKPPLHRFGAPDANGIVGESSTMWRLRERIRFVAGLDGHVLVRGDSGTGKELVVRALHAHGDGGAFVSRNAATVPDGLVDAELFGNARNYPNAGMSERRGLVGDASGGTLFLDEFAEIPMSVQPHLLRVLDDGEYQRLGDTTPRISRFRLIAATNQPLEALRHDLLARFRFIVEIPTLNERIEDVPLLAAHLLGGLDRSVIGRFLDERGGVPRPRMTMDLARILVTHGYETNMRELLRILVQAVECSPEDTLHAPDITSSVNADTGPVHTGGAITPERIQEVLDRHNGVQAKAYVELGLPSRHALGRLIRKYGIEVRRKPTRISED